MLDILASLALKKPIFGALVFCKDNVRKGPQDWIPLGTDYPLDFGILGPKKFGLA